MFPPSLINLSDELLQTYTKNKIRLATAESCTGGLISALLTETPGSSVVLDRGFVTYCNQSKTDMLGVEAELIEKHGAVSEEVARAMASGALTHSNAQISVAVTGIAGPGGGSAEKPVGLVYIACATQQKIVCEKHIFSGNRLDVRLATVLRALEMLSEQLP